MLNNLALSVSIPAKDLERAKAFYADKLGYKPTEERPDGVLYESGGSRFMLYQTQYAGTAQHTLAGWEVSDLEAEINTLRSRGVKFEEYDTPNLKTTAGIATMGDVRGAWFKDSEGNILGLMQPIR